MRHDYKYQAWANIEALVKESEYDSRYCALKSLYDIFENNHVKFALAFSANLYLRGIVDDFFDLDIIVEKMSGEQLKQILTDNEVMVNSDYNSPCFKTEVFLNCTLYEVQFEPMIQFGMRINDINYAYDFSTNEIEYVEIENRRFPILATEVQYILYAIMEDSWQEKRRYKRLLIEENLKCVGLSFRHVFERALTEELPEWIQNNCERLLRG